MGHLSGIQIIHARAAALNNAGTDGGSMTDNLVQVKHFWKHQKVYPYVSAQAYRYWLRQRLEAMEGWHPSPIYRERKVAYTDANPIRYEDDDLFGYMRAPGKQTGARESREGLDIQTPVEHTITRISPFRVGTLVGMEPGVITDQGTMSRQEGDPVPFVHQFYDTFLQGLFGVQLDQVGVFSAIPRMGYLHLDAPRIALAQEMGLEEREEGRVFVLPLEERLRRIRMLGRALVTVHGGASQTLHHTDVAPVALAMAVLQGANNPFLYAFRVENGQLVPDGEALLEVVEHWGEDFCSPLYLGWVRGASPEGWVRLEALVPELEVHVPVRLGHPRRVMESFLEDLNAHPGWLER